MPSAGAARSAVNGFVRYIQYRDHHEDVAANTSRMVRYVGYRDPTSRGGQLFDRSSRAGDLERKALVAHVRRSLRELSPGARPLRAVYRFVLSPADARGLDLHELARNDARVGTPRRATPTMGGSRPSQHATSARPHRDGSSARGVARPLQDFGHHPAAIGSNERVTWSGAVAAA